MSRAVRPREVVDAKLLEVGLKATRGFEKSERINTRRPSELSGEK
jgi:hypothetical protein